MVFCIEPGAYAGEGGTTGAGAEKTVLVTEGGPEILSQFEWGFESVRRDHALRRLPAASRLDPDRLWLTFEPDRRCRAKLDVRRVDHEEVEGTARRLADLGLGRATRSSSRWTTTRN